MIDFLNELEVDSSINFRNKTVKIDGKIYTYEEIYKKYNEDTEI